MRFALAVGVVVLSVGPVVAGAPPGTAAYYVDGVVFLSVITCCTLTPLWCVLFLAYLAHRAGANKGKPPPPGG